jgi:hypothetical protein
MKSHCKNVGLVALLSLASFASLGFTKPAQTPAPKISVEKTKLNCLAANGLSLSLQNSSLALAQWALSTHEYVAELNTTKTLMGPATRLDLRDGKTMYNVYLTGALKAGEAKVLSGVIGVIWGLPSTKKVPEGTPVGFQTISTISCNISVAN